MLLKFIKRKREKYFYTNVYTEKIHRLKDMIHRLEENRQLSFTTISGELRFIIHGAWDAVGGFKDVFQGEELRVFAEKLNDATYPIRMEFLSVLKKELEKECLLLVEKNKSKPNIKYETEKKKEY